MMSPTYAQGVGYSIRLRYCAHVELLLVTLTHSCLALDDQQFLTVFIKCGRSEKIISCLCVQNIYLV